MRDCRVQLDQHGLDKLLLLFFIPFLELVKDHLFDHRQMLCLMVFSQFDTDGVNGVNRVNDLPCFLNTLIRFVDLVFKVLFELAIDLRKSLDLPLDLLHLLRLEVSQRCHRLDLPLFILPYSLHFVIQILLEGFKLAVLFFQVYEAISQPFDFLLLV